MSKNFRDPRFPGIMPKPGESKPGVPLESTFTPHPEIIAGESKPGVPRESTYKLNPFDARNDYFISWNISSNFHDAQAVRQDVDSLFNVLCNIVISTSTNFTDSLDLNQVTVHLVENKVPKSVLEPTYSLLQEITCQMTCHSFNKLNAHESVVGVLQKLQSYTWDSKAVIVLSAFALNYGNALRLTVPHATSKNELHVFTLAKEEKKHVHSDSNLIKLTLQLIMGIITLEKFFANKSYSPNYFSTFPEDPRGFYTYWAILSLFACANQMGREEIQSMVLTKLTTVLNQLKIYLNKIRIEQERLQDLIWRFDAFQNSSEIWQLLKALIYPIHVDKPINIFANNATNELLTLGELKTTENLLLFISGLDIDLEIIESLSSIHEHKKGKIVWVPVMEHWTNEIKEKFEKLKSKMPSWYVVECFSLIEGYEPLQKVWNYRGEPIVVVTDASGKVLNQNALHPIILWAIEAFPFDAATIIRFSQRWNWFWPAAIKIHPPIQKWITSPEKYVFFYGGTSSTWTQKFHDLLGGIKGGLKETNTCIEHFNFATITDTKVESNFWFSITQSLLRNTTQNVETNLNNIQMLLSMKNQKGWAIVSKGKEVFLIGYKKVMMNVLQNFEQWQTDISGLGGFNNAIKNYYLQLLKPKDRPCMKFQLNNIPSSGLIAYTCPEPTCGLKMDIDSVTFKCCHRMHFVDDDDDDDDDFPFQNGQ